jgi:UDP-glucuronate decarboxylase
MKILLIGFGFVGKATYLLNNKDMETFIYDSNPELCIPKNIVLDDMVKIVDLIFISLPTPTDIDDSCHTKLIDEYINKLNHCYIIIRSTVPIGYCDNNRVFFMPEFLTEKNWKTDFITNKHWLFGIYENCPLDIENIYKEKITTLINSAYENKSIQYNDIHFGKNKELELNKIIRNTFLATKVSYFNEIYDLAESLKIDYNNVIKYVEFDERIGNSHMLCPGHDGKRGYGGTCFPKDIHFLYHQLNKNNNDSFIIQSTIERNETRDRVEKDWMKDINRTNIRENKYNIILVTGGAGFLGRHLCKRLLEKETNKVICLDNLVTGSMENIKEFKNHPNFKFLLFDIKNKLFLPHIDEIYHLACIASPVNYKEKSIETLVTCFEGTKNVLEMAKYHRCKLLFTSTSEIYGDPLVHPQPEHYFGNVNTVGERSCYDEGKRVAETLIYEYRKKYNLDLKIVRLFNTYGPYMSINDGRVITNMIRSIKTNTPIEIYGDGTQTRSFCYVDDLIEGLLKMMDSIELGPINLGNPYYEMEINELVKTFEDILEIKINKIYKASTENDPTQRKPVIDLANEKLGFDPKISLVDGIKKTLDHFFTGVCMYV